GTGTPASVLEVIQIVQEVTGLDVPHEFGPRRDGDVPAAYAYPAKAIAELGWEIEFPDIKSIVETAWKWHESHPNGFEK
ncbi:MAG: UDP-glucose 4-epimerase, partial [Candidatus Pelagisphaera sp.]